jgi:hypothetical protein
VTLVLGEAKKRDSHNRDGIWPVVQNDPVPYYCVAQVEKVLWNTIFLIYTIYDVQTHSAFISLVGPRPWAPMGVAKCCRVRIGDTNVDVGSNVVERHNPAEN